MLGRGGICVCRATRMQKPVVPPRSPDANGPAPTGELVAREAGHSALTVDGIGWAVAARTDEEDNEPVGEARLAVVLARYLRHGGGVRCQNAAMTVCLVAVSEMAGRDLSVGGDGVGFRR